MTYNNIYAIIEAVPNEGRTRMPLVLVTYRPGELWYVSLLTIKEALPVVVADALTVPGTQAELSPSDVEVWIREDNDDVRSEYGIQIVVLAADYAERASNLAQRRLHICEKLRLLLQQSVAIFSKEPPKGFVWILLIPHQSFGTF